ncbi:MAG: hypothetical protein H7268_09255 [Sandarakinorhabdus sp.]|nr:hypothetical protein [Sandarakinorhabdus sp.]
MPTPASGDSNGLLIAIIFLLALVPILLTPVLPLIDFYNHIARYYILSHIDSVPAFQENYRAAWALLPNIGLDVVVTGLMTLLPPAVIPRLTIALIFAVQFGGILYCNRALTGRTSVVTALLAVPLLYSFILIWGFANFLLGLGLVFWGAGWWLRNRTRLAVGLPVAMVAAVLIFLVHGLAFALYGILVGTLEIGIFLNSKDRRVAALVRSMLPLAAQAVIPVLMFRATATVSVAGGLTNADESIVQLSAENALGNRLWELLQYRLVTIVRVAEGPSLAFDAIVLVATLLLLFLLFRRGRLFVAPIAWPALAAGALLIVVVPPAMFAAGYVADRMPLFVAMLFVAALGVRPVVDRADRLIVAGLAGLVAIRLVAVTAAWHAYGADNADFAQVAASVPPGALVETIMVGNRRIDDEHRRCHMYGPLLISQRGSVGRLFAARSAHPLALAGPLAASTAAEHAAARQKSREGSYWDDSIEIAAEAGVPWILVCDGDRLTRPIPGFAAPVAAAGRFSLYRLTPPDKR